MEMSKRGLQIEKIPPSIIVSLVVLYAKRLGEQMSRGLLRLKTRLNKIDKFPFMIRGYVQGNRVALLLHNRCLNAVDEFRLLNAVSVADVVRSATHPG